MVKDWIMAMAAVAMLTGCVVEEAPPVDDEPKSETIDGLGECMTHESCGDGMLCQFAFGSCGNATGSCQPAIASADAVAPHVIESGPVCGCDGQNFYNAGSAWMVGVSVWFDGICEDGMPPTTDNPDPQDPVGAACPGGCSAGEFCFSTDGSCSVDGGIGECRKAAAACTSSAQQVCGCDGDTYGSECSAISNGASIVHPGAC
jgi:hypothetical protein